MTEETVRELGVEECWEELEQAPFGRLALSVGDDVDIFPINFVVAEGRVYLRTAPGTKLLELSINAQVALEVDRVDEASAVSVVLKGRAERLERQSDIDAAERLGLVPWIPTLKYRWVRIAPTSLSGRAFRRAPEPSRD